MTKYDKKVSINICSIVYFKIKQSAFGIIYGQIIVAVYFWICLRMLYFLSEIIKIRIEVFCFFCVHKNSQ